MPPRDAFLRRSGYTDPETGEYHPRGKSHTRHRAESLQYTAAPFCGTGALLVGARELGAHVIGCDTSPEAIRQASTKLPLTAPVAARTVSRRRPTGRATR